MTRPHRTRLIVGTAVAVLLVTAVLLGRAWKRAGDVGGQKPVESFRIAGNLYYVGANDVAAFLLTGPEGHVLLDGGYPGTPPLIMASIARLGFDVRDVRILLNSEPHGDHAGGLAALKRASDARLLASEASAFTLASGGDDPDTHWALRPLLRLGLLGYPPVTVDQRIGDGDTVRVGPIALAAHVTPGHTRGCTTWSFRVEEAGRTYDVVSACSLVVLGAVRWEGQEDDLRRTFARLRAMPADIWVTSHGRLWGRYRKFAARDTAASSIAPFVDRAGYDAYIARAESELARGIVH